MVTHVDYMTEIATAALPLLSGAGRTTRSRGRGRECMPEAQRLTDEVESALKSELGWSRFLDIWRDGAPAERRELLVDLLYCRPQIAVELVRTLLRNRYPDFLKQLAQRIRGHEASSNVMVYRQLPEPELLPALLGSPERVLSLAEFFSMPIPLSTAEHVLWSAAQKASSADRDRLTRLMARLMQLKQQLDNLSVVVAGSLDGNTGHRSAVQREMERTEDSMRRLEKLLTELRDSAPPELPHRRDFHTRCRRSTARSSIADCRSLNWRSGVR